MNILIAFAFLVGILSVSGFRLNTETEIIDGKVAGYSTHDYLVGLERLDGSHFWGGSLLTSRLVITAAHCVIGKKNYEFKVKIGDEFKSRTGSQEQTRKPVQTIVHTRYNTETYANDAAVIILDSPVTTGSNVAPIEIADSYPADGTDCRVIGWGDYSSDPEVQISDYAMEGRVNYLSKAKCKQQYPWPYTYANVWVVQSDGGTACKGDSGGPLVCPGPDGKEQLIGSVSFGFGGCPYGKPKFFADLVGMKKDLIGLINRY